VILSTLRATHTKEQENNSLELASSLCVIAKRVNARLLPCQTANQFVAPLMFVQHDLLKSFATAQIPSIAIRRPRANLVASRAGAFEALLVCYEPPTKGCRRSHQFPLCVVYSPRILRAMCAIADETTTPLIIPSFIQKHA
jgi:hypothetical protein